MSHAATPVSRFIGCDVGKTAIVVFEAASARTRSIANEPRALFDFAASLDPACFVVCEATGGYEGDLLAALLAAGVPAHRADARKSLPSGLTRGSKPSSARSERSAKPTPSTPGRWPDTPRTAAPNSRSGKPATATACACRPSS
jgi:hypothetical protein